LRYHQPKENRAFVGREREWALLTELDNTRESAMIVVHGRRRVGKTELIEQFFRTRNLWKFEGIQVLPPGQGATASASEIQKQLNACTHRLGEYLEQERVFRMLQVASWTDFFALISPIAEKQTLTLYFEEVQWLAVYCGDFFAELKPFWDDKWRHNKKLRIVFSGSSPSFLVNQFLADKALYNRSQHQIALLPFSLHEINLYLGRIGSREKLLAAMLVGGVPEYLRQLRTGNSVFLELCKKSFVRDGFFLNESDKVFVSSLSQAKHYRRVVETLATDGPASRSDLAKRLGMNSERPGGSFSLVLDDLEKCGFIVCYAPVQCPGSDKIRRYRVNDEMLAFYYRIIKPRERKIASGTFEHFPERAVNKQELHSFLGLCFERWCVKSATLIATALGFHGVVEYEAGAYFSRRSEKVRRGFQIDLMFVRKDLRIVVVEAKYYEGKIPAKVADEIDDKIALLLETNPKYAHYTIERVLVTTGDLTAATSANIRFDRVLGISDLFQAAAKSV
jgi:hypothetical protein